MKPTRRLDKSNTEMSLPDELERAAGGRAGEVNAAKLLFILFLLGGAVTLPLVKGNASYLAILKEPGHFSYWSEMLSMQVILGVFALSFIPVLWWICIKLDRLLISNVSSRLPVGFVLSLFIVAVVCVAFESSSVRWLYQEALAARIDRVSLFDRGLVNWKRSFFNQINGKQRERVLLVGSSQMDNAVNEVALSEDMDHATVYKEILPGFGIMQYYMVSAELMKKNPDIIVCWLSEFDTFRGHSIPSNRLRYFASVSKTVGLIESLNVSSIWKYRGNLADMGMASVLPIWRERDLLKTLVWKFWWRKSDKEMILGESADAIRQYGEQLKSNIHRSDLLKINFLLFEKFALALRKAGIKLYVFEGVSHPIVMSMYDPDSRFRLETRHQFKIMAAASGFRYISEKEMPLFSADDFRDATHLNQHARARFTAYLAGVLRHAL